MPHSKPDGYISFSSEVLYVYVVKNVVVHQRLNSSINCMSIMSYP